jgi:hypothetical protein
VDTWETDRNLQNGGTTESLGVRYKFAIPSWHNGFQTGYRPLQEVELFGTHRGQDTNNSTKVCRCFWSHFLVYKNMLESISSQSSAVKLLSCAAPLC